MKLVGFFAGLLFGLLMGHLPGWFIGIALGLLLVGCVDLMQRLTRLESRMARESFPPDRREERLPLSSPVTSSKVETAAPPGGRPPFPPPLSAAPPSPVPAPRTVPPPSVGRGVRPEQTPFEQAVGRFFSTANLPVLAGVVILFFGVAFLLKYAAAHVYLPIEFRLTTVSLGAILLLGVGWRYRLTKRAFALGLQGGGIGMLYLTTFAALRLYGLLSPTLAFSILVAVGVFAALLAILDDSPSLAVLGVAGGFLAPILASTGSGSHVMLFSYYALLNAGIMVIAWYRPWRVLNLTGFFFTFVIGALWGGRYYNPTFFSTTEPFLILFFLMYVVVAILHAWRQPPKSAGFVDGTLVFGTPIVAFALQALLVWDFNRGLALSALMVGTLYLGLARILLRRETTSLRVLGEAFLAFGVIFATLTIPLAFDGRWTSAAWGLEGGAIVWLGVRQERLTARIFGSLLILAAGFFFLFDLQSGRVGLFLLNRNFLGATLLSISALVASWLVWQRKKGGEPYLAIPLFVYALLWWYGGGAGEIDRFIDHPLKLAYLVALFTLTSLAATTVAQRLKWPYLRFPSLALLPGMVVLTIAAVLELPRPSASGGWLVWPLAYIMIYRALKHVEEELPRIVIACHAVLFWLITFHLTWEVGEQMGRLTDGAPAWTAAARGVTMALVLTLVSLPADRLLPPWRRFRSTYLTLGAWPVVVVIFCWLLLAAPSLPGDPWFIPYYPLANPLDLASLALLISLVAWRLRLPEMIRPEPVATQAFTLFWGAGAFVWLNTLLLRTIHHYAFVDYSFQALFASNLVQTSLAIFWTLLALAAMVVGRRLTRRHLWLTGAILLAVVVLKLFFVDLAHTGTVARIVSFMGVGILLLAIGFLSPMPPQMNKGA